MKNSITPIIPAYDHVVNSLYEQLVKLDPIIIGIDGRTGIGKTTLSRYLSWYFNTQLLECDALIKDLFSTKTHYYRIIKKIIRNRIECKRPIIVDSIFLLDIMKNIDLKIDIHIYCISIKFEKNSLFKKLLEYENLYNPLTSANIKVNLNFDE